MCHRGSLAMSRLEQGIGGGGMELRKRMAGRWAVFVCALVMISASAAAQDDPKPSPSATQTDPESKPARPATVPDNSRVDNKTYVIGENDVLDIDVWKEKIGRASCR